MNSEDENKFVQENANSTMAHLEPIHYLLKDSKITEVCINSPREAFTEGSDGWIRHEIPALNEQWAKNLLKLVGNYIGVSVESTPSLSATLPSGERIQILQPPRIPTGKISVTIRRPSDAVWTLEQLEERGIFKETVFVQSSLLTDDDRKAIESQLLDEDKELLAMLREKQFIKFLRAALLLKKNLVMSGSTGSGKTTLTNAIISCIPEDERIITAEDTAEIRLPHLKQHVQLFYNKNVQGSVKAVFEDTLRMYPSRVLPAELRGDEAYFFINNVLNSGHPGTVTTIHANTSKLAFQRLAMMIQSSPEGAALNIDSIKAMLYSLIDVVVQMNLLNDPRRRVVREIYFDPAYAIKQMG